MGQRSEQRLVQELVAQSGIEGLDEGVLHRFARVDVVPVEPGCRQSRSEWRCWSTRCHCRCRSPWACRGRQSAGRAHALPPCPTARGRRSRGQAAPGTDVVDRQNAEAPAADQLAGHEVQRPQVVRRGRHRHRGAAAQSALAATSFAHHQPFLAIQSEQPLVVHSRDNRIAGVTVMAPRTSRGTHVRLANSLVGFAIRFHRHRYVVAMQLFSLVERTGPAPRSPLVRGRS